MHFKIIIAAYNVEKWIKHNIRQIKKQTHKDFQCIVVDDISTDNTVAAAQEEIQDDPRFVLLINEEKKYALQNIYEAINYSNPADEDIVVTVDGDDWLFSDNSLEVVANHYRKKDIMLTYGSYVHYPDGRLSTLHKYPQQVIEQNAFREYNWLATHLRTFKYKLWKNIKKEDLLQEDGKFYRMTWDLAFMFPMLEMCAGKFEFINEPLYVYNIANPINDNKVNANLQLSLEKKIRNKRRYSERILL